jgi:hypothetical protein
VRDEWRDLSDSELRLKLRIRGCLPTFAEWAVHHRDDEGPAAYIERIMNGRNA